MSSLKNMISPKSTILNIIYIPIALPSILAFFFASNDAKKKIEMDVQMYWTHTRGDIKRISFLNFYQLLIRCKEFRNVFYCRLGIIGRILPLFLRPVNSLFINPTLCKNYGGGLYIAHGTSTQIYANKIGKNIWMHHNVTIGMKGEGRPVIGDNVYIGTGAVVLGGIKIGNNVQIGANAIVVDDVPDNAVVVSPKARVVKIIESAKSSEVSSHSTHVWGGGKYLIYSMLRA